MTAAAEGRATSAEGDGEPAVVAPLRSLASSAEGPPNEPHPRRAIVCGGGGVLGFAWMVGALGALETELGFDARQTEILLGTSAGSVVAALLSCGLSVDEIRRHHQGIPLPEDPLIDYDYDYDGPDGGAFPPRPRLRPGSPRLLLAAARHPRRIPPLMAMSGALPSGRGTLAPIHQMVAGVSAAAGFGSSWPDSPRPWIVAADYRNGRRVVFGRDRQVSLADAVLASCSIPGWYAPAVIDGRPYIDGGVFSNASTDVLQEAGLEEVYLLAPMATVQPLGRSRFVGQSLEHGIRRLVTRRILADVARLRAAGTSVMVLTPGEEDLSVIGINLMDSHRRGEVLETAMRTTADQIRDQRMGGSGPDSDGASSAGPAKSGSA